MNIQRRMVQRQKEHHSYLPSKGPSQAKGTVNFLPGQAKGQAKETVNFLPGGSEGANSGSDRRSESRQINVVTTRGPGARRTSVARGATECNGHKPADSWPLHSALDP